jgi:hypothetical protein
LPGKISYVKNFNSKEIVINIQDLHCHGESQKNIAAILKNFEKYGFGEIYLEGAVDNVSTQKFINLKESGLGRLVIDDLVMRGTLSGAEYYSIKADKPDIIKALDESGLYFENIMLLGNILENQNIIKTEINGLKESIEAVKKDYYNSDLLRLDKFSREFAENKISAKKYYSIINKLSKKADINTGAYANVARYVNLINEKGIDYRQVTAELKTFTDILKEKMPYAAYNELSLKSNNFSEINDLMPVLAQLSDSYGICASYKLKQLDIFFKYLKANEDLDVLSFVNEEERLIYDIGISLAQTKYERETVFLNRFVKVLEGFFTAKITSADYDYYVNNYKRFEETSAKYIGTENRHFVYLKENIPLFEKYHANNIKRDDIFLSSLFCSNETTGGLPSSSNDFSGLKEIMESAKKDAKIKIVITGGFHSEGLKKRLLERKTSFVIITPNVSGGVETAENAYAFAISEYYQVFTSAINKMPLLSDPLQISLPKIVVSAINTARTNQMPLDEIQELINEVLTDEKESVSATRSQYEHVTGAEIVIDSTGDDNAEFTLIYDYGYGKHFAKYVYDFKTNSVYLTVDGKKVNDMYKSYYHDGKEGFYAPGIFISYENSSAAQRTAGLFSELGALGGVLSLMNPAQLFSTVSTGDGIFKEKKSPMKKALLEPPSDADLLKAKNMTGKSLFEINPFKAKLSGNFKLMPDGVIVYQIDDPKILDAFTAMRAGAQNGQFWSSPEIVHITIGRLIPGQYSQSDIDKIVSILNAYNKNDPLSDIEFDFDGITFGSFSVTANEDIKAEKIKFGSNAKKEAADIKETAAELVAAEIDIGLETGKTLSEMQTKLNETFKDDSVFANMSYKGAPVRTVEVKLDSVDKDLSEFFVKYVYRDGSYSEIKYKYEPSSPVKLYRSIDEKRTGSTIKMFFDDDNGVWRERFSDPAIIVNNKSISGNFLGLYGELKEILSEEKAFLLQPEYYHFSFNANRRVFFEGSRDITLDHAVDKDILKQISETIPREAYEALGDITGKLEGFLFLASDGSIVFKLTNPVIIEAFNKARRMLDKKDSWGEPSSVHMTVGRLFPGKNTQEDIDKINAVLDKYNENNPFGDIEYTFNNVLFGQFAATGNGFVNVVQLNADLRREIVEELSYFDNATRFNTAEDGSFFEAENVEDILAAIDGIAANGLSRYELTFDALLPEGYENSTEEERENFKRNKISFEKLYAETKNVRDSLIFNARKIKSRAAEKNVSLSMHSFSLTCMARDETDREIAINPHPGFNDKMRDIFRWQLEIAEALGIENLTVHLEDFDTYAYAVFVKEAALKKIKVNFENSLAHSTAIMETPDSFYYHTFFQGFMPKEKFVETMKAIQKKLTKREQKYLGVTLDTSKALNSYLKTLPVDASYAQINEEVKKLTLENLIDYYETIINAGLTINNIHLAQFSVNIADFRKRKSKELEEERIVVYNKSDVDDLVNPSLNMAEFLRYLKEKGYKGALHQETPGMVSPAMPFMAASSGKKSAKARKKVDIYDNGFVSGAALLKNKKTLKLDADALRYMHYVPGEKVYIAVLPDRSVFLFTQIEALKKFTAGLPKNIKRNIMKDEGIIDEKGVLKFEQTPGFLKFAGKEKAFRIIADDAGVIRIFPHQQYVDTFLAEQDDRKAVYEEYLRGIEEEIRATTSSISFTDKKISMASRFLNEDQTHITASFKTVLESMLKEDGLNRDQKAFIALLLTAISAKEKPDLKYVKRQIKNAEAINVDSLIVWLEMIKNPGSDKFFNQIIDYLHAKSKVSKYSETFLNALGSLAVYEELKKSLAVSENEKWLLETERDETPGRHMLYGKVFVEGEMSEEDIDFERLRQLESFGIKPLALTFSQYMKSSEKNRLGYVNIETGGKTVTVEFSVNMKNNIPVISMVPLNLESTTMDHKDIYVKAGAEILNVIQNDYTVKGKFAYLTNGISLLEKIVNFISQESLFRVAGMTYDFDLKAFAFNDAQAAGLANAVTELFPEAIDIQKKSSYSGKSADDYDYYDISSNTAKTKDFLVKVIKRLVLKEKESKSNAGVIVGERIDSKLFSMLDAKNSPLASSGINGLAAYFEKRMLKFDSAILLLEDISMNGLPFLADAVLIDWQSVPFIKNMQAEGKITENDLNIYEGDMETVRSKSLMLAETALKEISPEIKVNFDRFISENNHLANLSPALQFAQFILISQIKDNIDKIHNNSGKMVLSLNVTNEMTANEIIKTALFWQSLGFDGIRINLPLELLEDHSILKSLSSKMKSVNGNSILMFGLPMSSSEKSIKAFTEKAAAFDMITAIDVSKLDDSLAEYKQKIWADINSSNEEYRADMSKYFEDIRKAIAFGAGYVGINAGTDIISADGKSIHSEIMNKIKEMLTLNKTVTVQQAYTRGYATGLQSKDELKTGVETKKLIVRELIKLQNGQSLKQGMNIDENLLESFSDFLKAEPGIIKLKFVKDSLSEGGKNGIYAIAGYLRGMIEAQLLSDFREKNGLDDSLQSELLRKLLLLDFSMPEDAQAYGQKDFVRETAEQLSAITPDEKLRQMLEENYGGEMSKTFTDYALYIYMLKNNGSSVNEIIKNIDVLLKAHLSEINFGYGIPSSYISQSFDEKQALGEIIEMLAFAEQKPVINKSVKDAISGSVNTVAVSMMLKAA